MKFSITIICEDIYSTEGRPWAYAISSKEDNNVTKTFRGTACCLVHCIEESRMVLTIIENAYRDSNAYATRR